MNFKTIVSGMMIIVVIATSAIAQEPPKPAQPPTVLTADTPPPRPSRGGLFDDSFFPAELVMQHQKAIGLSADQETAIRKEMSGITTRFNELQWKQSAEVEALSMLVHQDRPDEKQVLEQLDKLMAVENDIKRLHTGLLVRIKNLLTPEQQQQLRALTVPHIPRPANSPGDS